MAAKKKIKVKDQPNLVRDSFSKAILNSDRGNYGKVKARKKMLKAREEKMTSLESEVGLLKDTVAQLAKIVEKLNKTK